MKKSIYHIIGTDFSGNKKEFCVVPDAGQAEKYREMLANGFLAEYYEFSVEEEKWKS